VAALDGEAITRFRDVVVVGGGCYGSFYAEQLALARARGKVAFRTVVVVDRDPGCQAVREGRLGAGFELVVSSWDDFFDQLFSRPAPPPGEPDDAVVPSPLMPHLMAHWLVRQSGRTGSGGLVQGVVETPLGTPYDVLAPDGTRYVSFADWLCPTHCIEPHICPVIRAPRTWEMTDALERYVARRSAFRRTLGPALFVTRHRAFGVGMFDAAPARRARDLAIEAVETEADLLVATISSCHGAVTVLTPDR
jgi:hypothetical protein